MCVFQALWMWCVLDASKLTQEFYGESVLCGNCEWWCLWSLLGCSSCLLVMASTTKESGGQH